MNPLWKWVGGKRQLLPELLKHVPNRFTSYHEPFVGGGALFFDLVERRASMPDEPTDRVWFLSDASRDLVNLYKQVRNVPFKVLVELSKLNKARLTWNKREHYLAMRSAFNERAEEQPDAWRAAAMLYLLRTCFNGLWRVNGSGKLNAPFGDFDGPILYEPDTVYRVSEALERTAIQHLDFAEALGFAGKGSLAYCDPPYIPVSDSANFTSYSVDGFSDADQVRLADALRAAADRGVHVIASNADVPRAREIYKERGFALHEVQARRAINSKGDKRGPVGELIITSF
jgi:DNA adenine methylase